MDFKPLIVVTQPRIIPQFVQQFYNDNVGKRYDRLVIQYTPITTAYQKAREIFLRHTEYTHYIYATDDILWTNEGLERLIADYHKHFNNRRDIVLVPDMNTDQEAIELNSGNRAFLTYKHPVPTIEYGGRYTAEQYQFAKRTDEEVQYAIQYTDGIIKCSWSALGLAIIPRYIVENTSFYTDIQYNNAKYPDRIQIDPKWGCCMDAIFAKECLDKGFSIYTDLNVSVEHLKQSNVKNLWLEEYFRVGKDPHQYFFLYANTNERRRIRT